MQRYKILIDFSRIYKNFLLKTFFERVQSTIFQYVEKDDKLLT